MDPQHFPAITVQYQQWLADAQLRVATLTAQLDDATATNEQLRAELAQQTAGASEVPAADEDAPEAA